MSARDVFSLVGPPVALLIGLGLLIFARRPEAAEDGRVVMPSKLRWVGLLLIPSITIVVVFLVSIGEASSHLGWLIMPLVILGIGGQSAFEVRSGTATHNSLMHRGATTASVWMGLRLAFGDSPDNYVAPAVVLLGATALLGTVLTNRRSSPKRTLLAVVFIPLLTVFMVLHARGPDLGDVHAWAESFDEPDDAPREWTHFGFAARWLRARGVPLTLAPATRTARSFVGAGLDDETFVGAYDAGVLRPQDIASIRNVENWVEGLMTDSDPASPERVRVVLSELDPAQRAQVAERVDAVWPIGEVDLRKVYESVRIFELLGVPQRIEARRQDIQRVLVSSFIREKWGRAPKQARGFSRNPTRGNIDDEANWMALELMSLVGVPDGINLLAFEKHLQSNSGMLITQPLVKFPRHRRLDRMSLLRLRLHWDNARPTWHRYPRYAGLIGLLCLSLMCLAIMARARRAPSEALSKDAEIEKVFS